jgi:hypothetical protein
VMAVYVKSDRPSITNLVSNLAGHTDPLAGPLLPGAGTRFGVESPTTPFRHSGWRPRGFHKNSVAQSSASPPQELSARFYRKCGHPNKSTMVLPGRKGDPAVARSVLLNAFPRQGLRRLQSGTQVPLLYNSTNQYLTKSSP